MSTGVSTIMPLEYQWTPCPFVLFFFRVQKRLHRECCSFNNGVCWARCFGFGSGCSVVVFKKRKLFTVWHFRSCLGGPFTHYFMLHKTDLHRCSIITNCTSKTTSKTIEHWFALGETAADTCTNVNYMHLPTHIHLRRCTPTAGLCFTWQQRCTVTQPFWWHLI